MEPGPLLEIARDWSFWESAPPPSVPRRVALPRELRPEMVLVVQGVRRCGKSTLLEQLIDRYEFDRARCLFINFEDPRLAQSLSHETLESLVDAFERDRGPGATYFLDEIQWVDGWQRWLRTQVDRPKGRRFVVTGSSAHLLSGELGSTLTGRHHTVELFPFDLAEYRVLRPRAALEEYLDQGGFPAAVQAPDRETLLRTLFTDIIERDVRERVGARSTQPLRQLAQMIFESAGSEMSSRRVASALGLAVDTAGGYIDAIENAYLALSCSFFAWSMRRRLVRHRKYYAVDTGLRRAVVTATGADRGKQLEAATFLLLRRRFKEVHYWRGEAEVDFVVSHGGVPTPVQVTWSTPTDRHERGIDGFHAAHPTAGEGVIVTRESFEQGVPELQSGSTPPPEPR